MEVVRPSVIESTALGAVYLAGLAVGFYESIEEIKQNSLIDRVFKPNISEQKADVLVKGWQEAVKRCMGWAK